MATTPPWARRELMNRRGSLSSRVALRSTGRPLTMGTAVAWTFISPALL